MRPLFIGFKSVFPQAIFFMKKKLNPKENELYSKMSMQNIIESAMRNKGVKIKICAQKTIKNAHKKS